MDNSCTPPGGDSPDGWPTQQLGPGYPHHDQAVPAAQGPAGQDGGRHGVSRAVRWSIGIAAAVVLVCGAAAAGFAVAGSTSPAAGPTGQAAVLNTMLSSASSPTSAATGLTAATPAGPGSAATVTRCRRTALALRAMHRPLAARAVRRACRARLLRLRVLTGIHGQFTFETKNGARTLAFERGVVQSVSSTAVVIRAQDGTTGTWDLVSDTVVRQDGKRVAGSALAAGQHVFAGGPVTGGVSDARLIVIRPAAGSSQAQAG